ncbi:transcriptional regulator [Saccharomonospora marina XMU15]|uniref:Transcriptional regulator n=2 Tax=Saccharomonospora TaxID=1851 RepID=H5X8H2_9PSEU|nr:transcriptional regulator [Saccharomonospora marina XMU15]
MVRLLLFVNMRAETPTAPRQRAGRTVAGRRRLRRALTRAAIDLFLERGYDATTVDDIAAAAGVGRRTFFRYFRSKEDAIFPNHDELLVDIERKLADTDQRRDPLEAVCEAVRLVLDFYLDDPEVSLKRYALTRTVMSLRDKEVASVDRYQRVFTRYLRARFHAAGDPLAEMRAPIAGAAVAAAHNHVLRQWLRGDGAVDAHALADKAFAMVIDAYSACVHADREAAETGTDTVVAVLRTSTPATEVARLLDASLRPPSGQDDRP